MKPVALIIRDGWGISPKGAGVVLAPVYKLFEYKGEGSLTKPDWHPKRF